MKQTKTIIFSALLTLVTFGAVMYSSCTKDPCSGVSCQNGGACSSGSCVCPSGYTGTFCESLATTSITYTNDTQTPIVINQNGNVQTISAGNSITYTGTYGSTLTASASTSGTYGDVISWTLSDIFPSSGNTVSGLDVSSQYFYLLINNTDPSYTSLILDVNYNIGGSSESIENVSIPNNGATTSYGVGYYPAYANTGIKVSSGSPSYILTTTATLPGTANQTFTFYYN